MQAEEKALALPHQDWRLILEEAQRRSGHCLNEVRGEKEGNWGTFEERNCSWLFDAVLKPHHKTSRLCKIIVNKQTYIKNS